LTYAEPVGARAIAALLDLRIRRYPHEPLLQRIWALRNNLTAYDGAYIALAEALDAPLVTLDRRMAKGGGRFAKVELL
jgi:predicted nucleic acid-binding protein